jgi:hypothetical protein
MKYVALLERFLLCADREFIMEDHDKKTSLEEADHDKKTSLEEAYVRIPCVAYIPRRARRVQ